MSSLSFAIIALPPLLISVILHEVAHGKAAELLGDPTARKLGRITLNPIAHIDPFLTLLLPAFLIFLQSPIVFGGAKPVPVDPRYFKNPRRGMMWVALAGPVTNFILAGLSFALFSVFVTADVASKTPFLQGLWLGWIIQMVIVNLVLGLFNLIPVPPLDGGRIAVGLLPLEWAKKWARLERYGLLIVVFLLYTGIVEKLLHPVIEISATVIERILGG